jgi:hypothetical protein
MKAKAKSRLDPNPRTLLPTRVVLPRVLTKAHRVRPSHRRLIDPSHSPRKPTNEPIFYNHIATCPHMAARNRVEKRNMVALEARQTQASSASKKMFPTPTVKIALSTAFAGPKSCADNLLTMLPPPFYNIRANEPVPVENNTVAACYPTEFLQSYTAVTVNVTLPSTVTSTLSSIVPAMSPLACPQNWCTALAGRNNYIVCCPS